MDKRGQILVIAITFLGVIVLLVGVLVGFIVGNNYLIQKRYQQTIAFNLAEAGIDKAINKINMDLGFGGEPVDLTNGSYATNVTALSGKIVQIESIGYYPSATNPKTQKTVSVQMELNTDDVAFHYGVQVGDGGLDMKINSHIYGNVFSNGPAEGSGEIHGTCQVATGSQYSSSHEVQSLGEDGEYRFGYAVPELDTAQSFRPNETGNITMVSLKLKKKCEEDKENKCPSNLTVRIMADDSGIPDKNNVLATGVLSQSLISMNEYSWVNVSIDTPVELTAGNYYWIMLSTSDFYPAGNTLRYWWWAKDKNQGYGNGVAKHSDNWDQGFPVWTQFIGDLNFKIYTGTNTNYIDGLNIDDDAYAYDIKNAIIGNKAYYTFIDGLTTVNGTICPNASCYPDSPAPGLQNMPISEANINDWKQEAINGGTITGDYTLDGTSAAIGPIEITGNFKVDNNASLEVTGTIYVHGTIHFSNNSHVYLTSDYGIASGIIISDGEIDVFNNVIFCGSGFSAGTCDTSNGSYIMLVTNSNKLDDTDPAINISNNAESVIFYAANGALKLNNNANIYEAVGYRLILENLATVTYESGLADANFTSGPGASWQIKEGTWQEF